MPQFDVSLYFSQVFWCFWCFLGTLFVSRFFLWPLIRKKRIDQEDLKKNIHIRLKNLNEEIEKQQKIYLSTLKEYHTMKVRVEKSMNEELLQKIYHLKKQSHKKVGEESFLPIDKQYVANIWSRL